MAGITSAKLYEHGEMARYTLNGCRCELCRKALNEYRKWSTGRTLTVDSEPYRTRIRGLMRRGYSYKAVADAAGIARSAVGAIIYGRAGDNGNARAAKRIRIATAEALDAVTISDIIKTGTGEIPFSVVEPLLEELLRAGARKAWIASYIAGKPTVAFQLGKGHGITAWRAVKLCDYYAEFTGRNPWQVLDEGRQSVSNVARLADLLDTLWGEWLTSQRIGNEFAQRWEATNPETVRRALEGLLDEHGDCDCYRVRYVESTGTSFDTRLVFATNPYAREEDNHAA